MADVVKQQAYDFLRDLEQRLNAELPTPANMRRCIPRIVSEAKSDDKRKHMRQPEDAFLYHYAFPIIFQHMQTVEAIGPEQARQSLLSEYYRNMPEYCLDTPARTEGHPFRKIIAKPHDIIAQWKGAHGAPLKQSCPDFAFREPFAFKIVFEGKFFPEGGRARAESELVTNIYQAFFYRGLPRVSPKKRSAATFSPPWDYDFACLFAYDASKVGTLRAVWDDLNGKVQCGFWEGANVYVMILRGEAERDAD